MTETSLCQNVEFRQSLSTVLTQEVFIFHYPELATTTPSPVPSLTRGPPVAPIPVTQTLDDSTIVHMREQKKKVMRQYIKVKHG
jgi:hypothetical protein